MGLIANDDEEEDDDVIGPAMPSAMPTNRTRPTSSVASYPLQTLVGGPLMAQNETASVVSSAVVVDTTGGREEWMLTPGEAKHMQGLTESFGVNRQFQSGKVAKKAAAELLRQREAERARCEDPEETARTQAILDEYRELRGPSLMEAHLEKKQKTKKSSEGGEVRRPFDREKDVLSRRHMDASAAHRLAEQAKELDSRFDKGSVQRNFL
eukprot:gene1560-3015_t